MVMTESISPDLLARYLGGEATPAERAAVERWAGASSQNAAELRRLASLWRARPSADWDLNRAWSRVSARMDEPVLFKLTPQVRVLALAATVMVAVGAAVIWRAVSRRIEAAPRVVAAAPGERRDLDLPDGTRILLAPGSSMTVAAGYGERERRVELDGEAWFEVHHDADRPFRVYAAGTVTEDLGTEFTVRARAGDPVRVVLVAGQASFGREGAPAVVLGPGDVGRLAVADTSPRVERGADVASLVAWRDGQLAFVDTPVAHVAAELSRWYAVEFRLADSALGSRRLTHTFSVSDLDDALEVLALSLGVRAERQGAVVTLR